MRGEDGGELKTYGVLLCADGGGGAYGGGWEDWRLVVGRNFLEVLCAWR